MDEKQLKMQLLLVAKGDKSALSLVYSAMKHRVFLLAYSILKDIGNAENVMQDTFVKVLENASSYRGNNAKSWIFTIARNEAYNFTKKITREVVTDDFNSHVATGYEIDNMIEFDMMISQLDDLDNQIVLMRLYSDMKHRQIAQILDITSSNSRKRYERALQKLKTYYETQEVYNDKKRMVCPPRIVPAKKLVM